MPRFKRGIQYSVLPVCFHNARRGVLDRPVKPGDDARRYGWSQSESPLMNPATKTSGVHPSAAHLRVVSDRGAGGTPGIQLSGVSKTYRSRDGDVPSLRPLDFHINAGEFFVVVGPSGCGKSTLLKMISGLLPPSSGEIFVEGEAVTKPHGNVGIVFQNSQYPRQRHAADRHEAAAAP